MAEERAVPGGWAEASTSGGVAARGVGLMHVDSLDGLRGLAVVGVLLYHGGVSWLGGGFLGVEAFFVLSGFLITTLLLAELARTSRIRLPTFWARRARRLLPALFCLVLVVAIYYSFGGPAKAVPGLEGAGLSALFYYSNWFQIWNNTNYFVANGPVSPFQHTWSLAIEEQFYVIWPLVVVGVYAVQRRYAKAARAVPFGDPLFLVALVGAIASAVDMAIRFGSGGAAAEGRVYYGTDTRAQALLFGAALAVALSRRAERRPTIADPPAADRGRSASAALAIAGGAGLLSLIVTMVMAKGGDAWLYRGGYAVIDLGVVALIASVVLRPDAVAARILAAPPLRLLGLISYGLYIWHFPLFLWLTTASTGLAGASLLATRLAVVLVVAVLSYVLVEQPIRHRRVAPQLTRVLGPVGAVAAALSLWIASALGTAGAAPVPSLNLGVTTPPSGPTCGVTLRDTAAYGLAPLPPRALALTEFVALSNGQVRWTGRAHEIFHGCPPQKALLVGDSVSYTLAVGLLPLEARYGVELAVAPLLGCGLGSRGQVSVLGTFQLPPSGCANEIQTWQADERASGARSAIVELGYRDSFDWLWNGHVAHLGQPAFDRYVRSRLDALVTALAQGHRSVLLLSVPFVNPAPLSDGSVPPQGSTVRHTIVNSMLRGEARRHPGSVSFLDLDRIVSPSHHFQLNVDGGQCRTSDGIHFMPWCGNVVAPRLFDAVLQLAKR